MLDWGIVSLIISTLVAVIMAQSKLSASKETEQDKHRQNAIDQRLSAVDHRITSVEVPVRELDKAVAALHEFRVNITDDIKEIKGYMASMMQKLDQLSVRKVYRGRRK